jgi:site-specific DNA-methyltransferase (adenine-specific)
MIERNTIHEADLFDLCGRMADQSVDMILADLPYGTTACSWDTVIPFEPMWAAFKRIIKPRGAIVLTASQPFTSALVMSWPQGFKYSWMWDKVNRYTGFLDAQRRPLRRHEDILVFGADWPDYYPQMEHGMPYVAKRSGKPTESYNLHDIRDGVNLGTRFPHSIVTVEGDVKTANGLHPTQKPVALFEYLIRTYTRPGELVFDPTAGSGTTAVAARQTGRHYIVGDSSAEYVAIMRERLAKPYTLPMMELEAALCHSTQL